MRHRIASLFSRRITPKVPERKYKCRTPPEVILEHILNVLDGAENLAEFRIIHDYGPRWDFSSLILHPVSAALSNRQSLRKLYVEGYRLDKVLPLVYFHGLTSVVIAISFSSELQHSMEVVPSFVKHVAPSVEILHFSVPDRGHSPSISLPMTEILCDNGKAPTASWIPFSCTSDSSDDAESPGAHHASHGITRSHIDLPYDER